MRLTPNHGSSRVSRHGLFSFLSCLLFLSSRSPSIGLFWFIYSILFFNPIQRKAVLHISDHRMQGLAFFPAIRRMSELTRKYFACAVRRKWGENGKKKRGKGKKKKGKRKKKKRKGRKKKKKKRKKVIVKRYRNSLAW